MNLGLKFLAKNNFNKKFAYYLYLSTYLVEK